jgi:AcrR family transcriptional regulator
MSRNVAKRKIDRRIRRTRDRLGDALMELVLEKPFDTITVQDVLDRAGVSRSTFYVHYNDKDDLFISDVDEFFEGMATMLSRRADSSDRVAPVRELFAHVADAPRFHKAVVASGKIHAILELGQGHFARGIEQRLAELQRARGITAERHTVAHALAGALLSLLLWWIKAKMPTSAAHMDDLYHRVVWTGIDRDVVPVGGRCCEPTLRGFNLR